MQSLLSTQQVGILPDSIENALAHLQSPASSFLIPEAAGPAHSDSDLYGDYETIGVGPMERRRKKKQQQKRRSASLSRVLTATVKGIQKAMSRSTTPTRHMGKCALKIAIKVWF